MAESCDPKDTNLVTLALEIPNISAVVIVRCHIYIHTEHFIVQKMVSMGAVDDV